MKLTSPLIVVAALAAGVTCASAQQHPAGSTSGPAAGGAVQPTTTIQKENPYIPDAAQQKQSGVSGTSAGAPGIEGKPTTQSGKAPGKQNW